MKQVKIGNIKYLKDSLFAFVSLLTAFFAFEQGLLWLYSVSYDLSVLKIEILAFVQLTFTQLSLALLFWLVFKYYFVSSRLRFLDVLHCYLYLALSGLFIGLLAAAILQVSMLNALSPIAATLADTPDLPPLCEYQNAYSCVVQAFSTREDMQELNSSIGQLLAQIYWPLIIFSSITGYKTLKHKLEINPLHLAIYYLWIVMITESFVFLPVLLRQY